MFVSWSFPDQLKKSLLWLCNCGWERTWWACFWGILSLIYLARKKKVFTRDSVRQRNIGGTVKFGRCIYFYSQWCSQHLVSLSWPNTWTVKVCEHSPLSPTLSVLQLVTQNDTCLLCILFEIVQHPGLKDLFLISHFKESVAFGQAIKWEWNFGWCIWREYVHLLEILEICLWENPLSWIWGFLWLEHRITFS